ncbi:MAG: NADH-quinone oxidoreductase subunit M [Streptosporangiales bacterium]|nr:NADH-quinone oxidoreductase subunit M [Streptosporangiales bacterium]
MGGFPWLTVLGAVPLAGSVGVGLLPRGRDLLAKRTALLVSLVALALALAVAIQFRPGGPRFQFTENYPWIPQFGIGYSLGVDGIALVLIGLSAILVPVVILASWNEVESGRSVKAFFSMLLMLEAMMIGVFAATDVFFFFVLFEASLVPMYFIIGSYGGPQRSYAAVKFLLYSLLGGLLMLVAVIGLYVLAGTFEFTRLTGLDIAAGTERWLFLGFFIAFAIKAPLWPFHTWLPDAAAQAPAGGAVLLVGVLDKAGTYGMIRYCLELFPNASRYFTPAIIALSVVGILYGALLAVGQADMKRLIAYTSLSHFGFIGLGIFAMTSQGQSGATLYMVNHGFATGALFLIAGFLMARNRSRLIDDYGGVQRVAPLLAGTFLVAGLSGLSLPGLNSFVSEFLVLVGTYTRYPVPAVLGTLGVILAALYILWLYQRTMTGPVSERVQNMQDLRPRELWAIGPLVALIIALGLYPKPVLDVINPAVQHTMQQVQVSDPPPEVPAAQGEGS